jgi:hypothetical protein
LWLGLDREEKIAVELAVDQVPADRRFEHLEPPPSVVQRPSELPCLM